MMPVNISPSNFLMKCIRQYFAIKKLYYTLIYCLSKISSNSVLYAIPQISLEKYFTTYTTQPDI